MSPVNHRTYQLVKGDDIVMETQAATLDRAIDYFFDRYPEAYTDNSYQFRYTKRNHEI